MARPRHSDPRLERKARRIAAATSSIDELRAAQAVLLPAVIGATLEQTATLLGVSRASVPRLQLRFRKLRHPGSPRSRWGGRRRSLLSAEDEAKFLAPWEAQAKDTGLQGLSPIRAALSKQLGRPVASSVVWRLLARHGWRKVASDICHPRSDSAAQQARKQTARKRWRPGRKKTPRASVVSDGC